MRPLTVFAIALSVLLAGCTADSPEATEPPAGGTPDTSKEAPAGQRAPARQDVAEAPDWQPGDWWRWQVTPRDAAPYEATTVVASVTDEHYVIGWGAIDEGLRSQFFHFVPSGSVAKDLTWEAHHQTVDWFDFPLEDGKNWTGSVWMGDLSFEAVAADVEGPGGTLPGFRVSGAHSERDVRVEYDWATDLEVFTALRFYLNGEVPWLSLTLLEHGSGRSDSAHLLHSEMAFATFASLEGSVSSTSPPHGAQPITIPEGVTHVALGCYLGGPPGYYAYRLSDSAGTEYGCEAQVTSDWFGLVMDEGPVAVGEGTSTFVTAGQGSVFAELFFVTAETVTPSS